MSKAIELFTKSLKNIRQYADKNSPLILTTMAVGGLVTTVGLTCKASFKAKEVIDEMPEESTKREKVKEVAPLYLPTLGMATVTTTCILASYKISSRRTAALAAAYSLSESRFLDYQSKVVEAVGKKKEEKIRDEVAKEKLEKNPVGNSEIIIPEGDTLCYDAIAGRYFRTSIGKIRQAEKNLTVRLFSEDFVSLNDLYYELDLSPIKLGDDLGWNSKDVSSVDIHLSSQLTEDDTPCLVLDYLIGPRYDYRTLY